MSSTGCRPADPARFRGPGGEDSDVTDQPGRPGQGWTTPEQPSGWGEPPGSDPRTAPQRPAPQAGPAQQYGWGQATGAQAPLHGSVISRRGIIALKPLGVGDFFDGAFRAIRHNPRVMVGLTAIVVAVTNLLVALPLSTMVATVGLEEAEELTDAQALSALGLLGALLPAVLLQSLALVVLTGLLLLSVSQSVVDRRLGMGELWRRGRGRLLPLVGWSVLQAIGGSLLFAVALAPGVTLLVLEEYVGGALLLLGLVVAAAVLGVWLYVMLALVPALVVVERLGVLASIRRSFGLVRGAFWRTLLVVFLASLLAGAVTQVLALPLGFLGGLLSATVATSETALLGINLVVTVVGGSLGAIIAMPFYSAVVALLYIDRRIRSEGLDVALARTLEDPTA